VVIGTSGSLFAFESMQRKNCAIEDPTPRALVRVLLCHYHSASNNASRRPPRVRVEC
jgi:hypothetical protein